ncbi:pyridoxine-5'-phosphate oxidase [Caerostris extrusa]|uniref:pyridoxal 5'-phosphate synthase n=1 Tax=Caerostris extrusa TaxID=172846 RepID=A0AAV4N1G8_CAEEX|nr:pyridoxine-5'-phosphate oxidase [Caerostris extrusa]
MDIAPVEKMDLGAMRVPYEPNVDRDFSVKNPIKLFDIWFNDARKADGIREANAMAVATSNKNGKPSVRYVLLKSYSKEGFIFFTNYNSRKGQEIAENPHVALLFYWEPLCRQGGFLIKPETLEFWCGRSDRLHDRIRFRQPLPQEVLDEKVTHAGEDEWVYEYLAP